MSYLKPFKTCSDHAVGIASVNGALNNNRALYFDQLDPNHSVGNISLVDRLLGPGRHDEVLIARCAADFSIRTIYGLGVSAVSQVGGRLIVWFPTQIKTGQWKVYVTTTRIFSAVATIKGVTTGAPRYATCFVSSDSTGQFVTVSTWNVAGGVLADYDFSLVVWADGIT